jgi:hypothetical protein
VSELERETREWLEVDQRDEEGGCPWPAGILRKWLAREALWREYAKLKAKHLDPVTLPEWLRLRAALGIES